MSINKAPENVPIEILVARLSQIPRFSSVGHKREPTIAPATKTLMQSKLLIQEELKTVATVLIALPWNTKIVDIWL